MNSLLSNAFVGYLTARVALGIANTMLIVAIGWHLYELTGDPWSLALVGLMQIIPVYVFFLSQGTQSIVSHEFGWSGFVPF